VLAEFGWARRNPTATMRFRIFVDDTLTPVANVRADSLCGKFSPFLPPLADSSSGWSFNYAPIPFQQRLRITYTGNSIGYHGCALIYPQGTTFESFRSPVSLAYYLKWDTLTTQWETPSRPLFADENAVTLYADSTFDPYDIVPLLSDSQSGVIRRFWMIPEDTTRSWLDRSFIRIFFDGDSEPAIAAPAGLLFACPYGTTDFQAASQGKSGDTLYFQIPMPFLHGFAIDFANNSPNPKRFQVGADVVAFAPQEISPYRLGADYNLALPTARFERFQAAKFEGRGNYLGLVYETASSSGQTLEGDERLLADGNVVREGIGVAEYFNGSYIWRDPNGLALLSRDFAHGVITVDGGDHAAYRFHWTDPVPFEESLDFSFEVGGWGHLYGNFRALAFAYLEPKRFSVRDADSSGTSAPGERLRIHGRGLIPNSVLESVRWGGYELEIVRSDTVSEDSILTFEVEAPYAPSGVEPIVAEFSAGSEVVAQAWMHQAEPALEFSVVRADPQGFAFPGDTLRIQMSSFPVGETATVFFLSTPLQWIGSAPRAGADGRLSGQVVLPSDPLALPETFAPLTARATSVEGFPDAVSHEMLTLMRLARFEIESLAIDLLNGGSVSDQCACEHQPADSLDPWGRNLLRRFSSDTLGEFVRLRFNVNAGGSYRLNFFFGKSAQSGDIQVVVDDVSYGTTFAARDTSLGTLWSRTDTIRAEWLNLNAGLHTVTFLSFPPDTIAQSWELLLDQMLLESEHHQIIPSAAGFPTQIPDQIELLPPYPNPFNSTAQLRFTLPHEGEVRLEVFNLLGQLVETLESGRLFAGTYTREFSCSNCGSGLYFARLMVSDQIQTQKLLLLK
jgi:hypothetical protein